MSSFECLVCDNWEYRCGAATETLLRDVDVTSAVLAVCTIRGPVRSIFLWAGVAGPGPEVPGAVLSLHKRGLFNHLGDFLRMNDERSMAAGDVRYLRLHTLGKKLLGLRCDHIVLGGDHIERRLVAPSGDIHRCLERLDTQRKLMVCQGVGDLWRKVSRHWRTETPGIN